MGDNAILPPVSGVNWKQNLFVIWLSQFLAMVGFGCCMPFIPLLLKENLHIDDENLGENVVAQVFQAGFKMGDKVIRYAIVQVAN